MASGDGDLARELTKEALGVIDKSIAAFNATLRAVFDSEHGKPVDAVLPVLRQRLAGNDFVTLGDKDLLVAAECISDGVIPIMARDTSGSMALRKGRQ